MVFASSATFLFRLDKCLQSAPARPYTILYHLRGRFKTEALHVDGDFQDIKMVEKIMVHVSSILNG